MTSKNKRFGKIILGKEKEYPYNWIKNFLEYYAYTARQTASSHVTFRRKDYEPIIIVIHHNKVKRMYVKKMIKALKRQNIL